MANVLAHNLAPRAAENVADKKYVQSVWKLLATAETQKSEKLPGCPTLATFLFLSLGWESTNLNQPALLISDP